MSKAEQKSITKPVSSKPKPSSEGPHLFFLEIPAEHPQMDPNPTLHYGLAEDHLRDLIENLETVEQLAAIDEENETVHAMGYGILAVLKKLRDIHRHFSETTKLIKPWPAEKRGASLNRLWPGK